MLEVTLKKDVEIFDPHSTTMKWILLYPYFINEETRV